jgi:hypothetical protein
MFQLAAVSVTLTVDEITDAYNKNLASRGFAHMQSFNHVQELEEIDFEPSGWILSDRWRSLAWISEHTSDEIYTNVFRYERKNKQGREERPTNRNINLVDPFAGDSTWLVERAALASKYKSNNGFLPC